MTEVAHVEMLRTQGKGAMARLIGKAGSRERPPQGFCAKNPMILPHTFPIDRQVSRTPGPTTPFAGMVMGTPPDFRPEDRLNLVEG